MELIRPPLRILYRGPLSSCNYDCTYCPFAKRHETAAELRRDREALTRFVAWASQCDEFELSLLFTPWGEALVRPWYQQTLVILSQLAHVRRVAIQTNLSCGLEWIEQANVEHLALWCTYHPSQISRAKFVARCRELDARDVRYSAGVVGLRESFEEIERLRAELSPDVYLWINAYKDVPNYYTDDEVERLERIDPLFRVNLIRHASLGKACQAGESALSIDGEGNIRRCHFVGEILGNIYIEGWQEVLRPRSCPNTTCGCYIGYVQMPHLAQERFFGAGMLERVPPRGVYPELSAQKVAGELLRLI